MPSLSKILVRCRFTVSSEIENLSPDISIRAALDNGSHNLKLARRQPERLFAGSGASCSFSKLMTSTRLATALCPIQYWPAATA